MDFPKSRIITAKQLAKVYKNASDTQRFCFILGAGASVESGIVDGKELEMRWMEKIMEDRENYQDFLNTAQALLDEKKIKHPFSEIKEQWEIAKEKGERLSSEYYFDLYKLRFCLNPKDGYHSLVELMEGKEPSVGYYVLAKLLTQDKKSNNLVVTTNFDSLVEDSLFVYPGKKPLVAGHESLACYIDSNAQRPVIAKVHRSLLFEPFNATEETSELKDEWKEALEHVFATYTPIVIGYAGGDQSLMTFLKDKKTRMKKGLYWCYRGKSDPPDYIQEFVKEKDGILVSIDGFDSLMLTIGSTLFAEEVTPAGTEACLKERMDQRMTNYNKQYAEVLKNTELKESVQAIDELQKANEKQREEANALTTWDHIRRGNRLDDEGKYSEAIEEHSCAIAKDPNLAAAYNNRGIAYDNLGKYYEAIADYTKAIELDPKDAVAYNNRGAASGDLEKHDEAIADFNKAIELDPKYADAYYNRGIAYRKSGKYAEVIADYTKAIELDPKYANAYHNRAIVYRATGQIKLAKADEAMAAKLKNA